MVLDEWKTIVKLEIKGIRGKIGRKWLVFFHKKANIAARKQILSKAGKDNFFSGLYKFDKKSNAKSGRKRLLLRSGG